MLSKNIEHEVLVIDDNSTDGTGAVVAERFSDSPQVRVFIREEERGLATATMHGIINCAGDTVVVMDSDFNHDPAMLPQMVDFLKYYDLIIGSRFVMGGGMQDVRRYLLSFIYNFFLRLVLRTQAPDNLSGFYAIRREKLLEMDLDRIFHGYGDYFIRLLYIAWQHHLKMLEVPVFYQLRRYGDSKSDFLKIFIKVSP